MITVSSITDNQHCVVTVAARFYMKINRQIKFLVVVLGFAAAEGNRKHLVSKAIVNFLCTVNPVQCTTAEPSLAQAVQGGLTQVAQHDSIGIAQ